MGAVKLIYSKHTQDMKEYREFFNMNSLGTKPSREPEKKEPEKKTTKPSLF